MSWILPEEEIEQVLREAVSHLLEANTAGTLDTLLERIFGNLSQAKRDSLRDWLTSNTINIVHGYPHEKQTFPCWAVLLRPSTQSQQYLGDQGVSYIGEGGEHLTELAERWRTTVAVITYSENADLTRRLGHLSAWFLSRGRLELSERFRYVQQPSIEDLRPEKLGDGGGRYIYSRAVSILLELDQTDVDVADVSELTGVQSDVGVTEVSHAA